MKNAAMVLILGCLIVLGVALSAPEAPAQDAQPAPARKPSKPRRADGVPVTLPDGPDHDPSMKCKHIRWRSNVGEKVQASGDDFKSLVREIEAALGLKLMQTKKGDTVDGHVTSAYGGAVVWVCVYTETVAPTADRLSTLRAAPAAARAAATKAKLDAVCNARRVSR